MFGVLLMHSDGRRSCHYSRPTCNVCCHLHVPDEMGSFAASCRGPSLVSADCIVFPKKKGSLCGVWRGAATLGSRFVFPRNLTTLAELLCLTVVRRVCRN